MWKNFRRYKIILEQLLVSYPFWGEPLIMAWEGSGIANWDFTYGKSLSHQFKKGTPSKLKNHPCEFQKNLGINHFLLSNGWTFTNRGLVRDSLLNMECHPWWWLASWGSGGSSNLQLHLHLNKLPTMISPQLVGARSSGWWLNQPIWKICSSK